MSDLRFQIEETSNLEKNGKAHKERVCCRKKRNKQGKKRETLVRLLWRTAAPGLTPLRLLRAQACGNRIGT